MSYFSFWHLHEAAVLHFHFAPTTRSCMREKQRGKINTVILEAARMLQRDGERQADRTQLSDALSCEGRCAPTSVDVVGGIYLKATSSRYVCFDSNLHWLKRTHLDCLKRGENVT